MRTRGVLILTLFLLSTGVLATPVDVALISLSPQVDSAMSENGDYDLSITSLDDGTMNGEIAPAASDLGFTRTGYFHLEDTIFGGVFDVPFLVDLPLLGDANGNGVDDFFDSAMEVPSQSTDGIYQDPVAPTRAQPFTATWQRDPNSNTGALRISLPQFGADFFMTFHLLEYRGVFEFTRTGTNLVGQTRFTNVFEPTDTITGPLTLKIKDTNTLLYASGTWSGLGDFKYDFAPEDNLDLIGLTYVSFLDFADGYSGTSEPDYQFWLLEVISKDANTNSIPDVVESGSVQPVPPTMQAGKGTGGSSGSIQVTISGVSGATYQLQGADSINGTWSDLSTVTLSGTSQTISIPISGTKKFFRLKQ